jgi:hypothetical protein
MATIKETFSSVTAFTLTLASLANSTAGVGRQSTLIDNSTNKYLAAQISLNIKVGTTPTALSLIYAYLIRSNADGTPIADDNAGATDAGLTVVNAPLLGTILVLDATSNANYRKTFNTLDVTADLGPKWGIAIVNSSGVALNASEGAYSWIGITKSVA